MRAHDELLGAIGDPAHRPAKSPRGEQQQDPFGIEEVLHAEAAADIGRMQADVLGRHPEDELGELAADAMHALAGELEIHRVVGRVVAGNAGARLEGRHDDAVVHHLDLDDVRGAAHRLRHRLGIAALDMEGEIARRLIPQLRPVGRQGGEAVDHRGERPVVDDDPLRGFARDRRIVGHDEGHGIADMAHPAVGQGRPRRHDQRLHHRQAGHGANAGRRQIGVSIGAADTGQRQGRRDVYLLDDRVGMRRAQDMAVQAVRRGDVVDIAPLSRQEPAVLQPEDRLADQIRPTAIAHAIPACSESLC